MSKKTIKNPAAKTIGRLPAGLRKILQKSRQTAVVLFEENDDGQLNPLDNKEILVPARIDKSHDFNVKIAESYLDVYRSPHLLDLSKANKIEKFFVSTNQKESTYKDLPGGEILERLGIFKFWDFKQSEILIFLKNIFESFSVYLRNFSNQPVISPKLDKSDIKPFAGEHFGSTEDLSVVGLILWFADFYYKIYLAIHRTLKICLLLLKRILSRDETVWLSDKKNIKNHSRSALLDRIIAASQEPSIAEIIKSPIQPPDGKFKIISPPLSRKEVEDKYLSDNFLRKAPAINLQPPVLAWPKNSLGWDIGNFVFSFKTLKPLAVFCGVLIALVCSVRVLSYVGDLTAAKGKVLGEAEQALDSLNSAQGSLKGLDFQAAQADFQAANSNFISAKNQLNEIKSFLTVLAEIAPAQNTFKSGTNIIELGEHLSQAANYLLEGINQAGAESDFSLSSRIKNLSLALEPALNELIEAEGNISNIGLSHLPENNRDKFLKLKTALPVAIESLKQMKESVGFASRILGDDDLRRYLLIFQNDNELRATGGFMGSFALIDFRNGQIEKLTLPAGGTYDLRRDFTELLAPPQPLQLVTDRWEFQDSNWWPDFPTSAKNIKFFYEKAGNPTVDGVIAVNSSFLGRLLEVTGPISLPNYGKTINATNFEIELQKSIEFEAKEKNKPKKILSEMAPLLLDKLLKIEPGNIFSLAEIISLGLKQKEIQMYYSEPELQDFASKNNWTGAIDQAAGDYLAVNSTNIGGGKTDPIIKQKIYHQAEILSDGRIIDRVLIERRNIGPTDELFTKIANNSYLRVYVPAGSKLLSAAGFKGFSDDKFRTPNIDLKYKEELLKENNAIIDELSGTKVYEEAGKTVFANWSVLGPQEAHDLLLVYELPFRFDIKASNRKNILKMAADVFVSEISTYRLNFQKQSGRSDDELFFSVIYPNSTNLKSSYPEPQEKIDGRLLFKTQTDADKIFVLGFVR